MECSPSIPSIRSLCTTYDLSMTNMYFISNMWTSSTRGTRASTPNSWLASNLTSSSLLFSMDVEEDNFLSYPDSLHTLPIENPTNTLDNLMPQLGHHTQPIDIQAWVAVSKASQEGASHTQATEQTNWYLMFADLVSHVTKAIKNHVSVQSSMSSVIAHIKYLHHTKWIPPLNVDNALDKLQSNSGWMAPTTSI